MISDMVIDGVLRGVLGGRPKRSHGAMRLLTGRGGLWSNPQTLLTAAGLAWGVYETLQNQSPAQGPAGTSSAAGSSPGQGQWWTPGGTSDASQPGAPPPPIPRTVSNAASASPPSGEALRIVRLAISAANADGSMSEQERAAVIRRATDAGVGDLVDRELRETRPLKEIVEGITDPAAAATLYVLAFTIVRADEHVTGAERIYLAQLANLLHLDADTVQSLEKDTGERIDRLGDQGQLGG